MISSKRVASTYLHTVIAESMTRDDAQKIVDKMPKDKLEKIKKLLQPFQKFFKKPFNKKDAALIDVVKKVNKTTGIPVAELVAVAMILFGAASPAFGDTSPVQDTKIEQVTQKKDISEVEKDLEKVFELPSGLMNLVKITPQGWINSKGVKGFVKIVNKNLSKSLTPEVSELLNQVPEDRWPEILSALAIQKIRADSKVNEKFQEFIKDQNTSEANMQREIASVVSTGKAKIKNIVDRAVARKAYIV
jgi:hypothetical protein